MHNRVQVSEISMPGILATSVFSAQNGEMLVFYRNSRLLIFLCFTSGISRLIYIKIFNASSSSSSLGLYLNLILIIKCSGLRSGCFAVANMILVRLTSDDFFDLLFSVLD